MLSAGTPMPPGAFLGRGFDDVKVFMMLFDGAVPVAAVVNVSEVSPNSCGADGLRTRLDSSQWEVSMGSSRQKSRSSDWHFFAIIHRPNVDKKEFRRVVIDDTGVQRTKNRWTDEMEAEYKQLTVDIDAIKLQMKRTPRGSTRWLEMYEEAGKLMDKRRAMTRKRKHI